MKKIIATLFLFACLHLCLIPALAQTQNFEPSEKAWKFADKQLKTLTIDEKIGQMVHIGINARFANQDSDFYKDLQRQVTENKIGGIVLFAAPIYETVHLVNRMQENAKIPLLIAIDAETGVGMRFDEATNFPWNMAVAATGNPEYARKIGVIAGREARALGIQEIYAPVLDVNNNAANPVINVRSYGENPEDVARFGAAFIAGIQSQRVIATAKHFPGHGDTAIDSHRGLPIINVSRERLDQVELMPFRQAIKSGVASIMVAHISLPQIDETEIKPLKQNVIITDSESGAQIVNEKATVPATLSPIVQTQILRKELKFNGLIVTDAMSMSGLTLYVSQEEAGVRAVEAGADLLEKPADAEAMIRGLRAAVKSGRISESRINESVRKLLAWKYELGLYKQKITSLDAIDKIVSNQEVRDLTNEVAAKSITLVRDNDKNLPLKKDAKVFVLGITNGFEGYAVANTLMQTLRQNGVNPELIVLDERSTQVEQKTALEKAKNADVVISALYGRVRSGAKNSVGLPDAGTNVLRELINRKQSMITLSFGNPYLLLSFPELKTYVVAYGDMPSLQRATANAITGKTDFSGKLPISLPGLYPIGTGIQLKAEK